MTKEELYFDFSDPSALPPEPAENFMTVNQQLEAHGVIHVYAKCSICHTVKTVEIPLACKDRSVTIKFTCGRCRATQENSLIATPVVYR